MALFRFLKLRLKLHLKSILIAFFCLLTLEFLVFFDFTVFPKKIKKISNNRIRSPECIRLTHPLCNKIESSRAILLTCSVFNFQRRSSNSKFGSLVFYGQCELFWSIQTPSIVQTHLPLSITDLGVPLIWPSQHKTNTLNSINKAN